MALNIRFKINKLTYYNFNEYCAVCMDSVYEKYQVDFDYLLLNRRTFYYYPY